ncbi:hypothetical protein OEZ85_008600 [Tetradesmus obliquus]|uniref:PX domain-containing protein n=1 Tax=Tetradesmus obliquus TaxID=3088 RepID=A0ABY8TJA5_TETOB|nr:hypothetical protein OEZ85_008600 [Tetradesmus obliquus]
MQNRQQQDPLDTLPSLTAGLSVFSQPEPEGDVVASFSLGSPEVGQANTYFGSPAGAAGAALQTISLTDDDDDHTVFAVHQPTASTSAGGTAAGAMPVEPAAAPEPAALPVSVLHSTSGVAAAAATAAAAAAAADDAVEAGQQADTTLPATVAGPLHAQDIPVKVWVRDPEKVARGFSSYVTYLLRTETSLSVFGTAPAPSHAAASTADAAESNAAGDTAAAQPGSSGSSSSSAARRLREGVQVWEVRRRFADFEELHRLLRRQFRGYFLPPLPDRAGLLDAARLAGGDSFMKVRKVDLQAYMCTIANHPALQGSQELRVFLTYPTCLSTCQQWQQMVQRPAPTDALLGMLRPEHKQQQGLAADASAGGAGGSSAAAAGDAGGGKLGGMMWRMKHSLMAVVREPKARPEVPADEQQLRQAKDWFKELQQHLSSAVTVAQSLVSHTSAAAEDFHDIGRSFTLMARYEEKIAQCVGQYTPNGSSAVQRAADLQAAGYASLRQHAVDKQYVLRTAAALVFLHDYWVLVPEAVAALEEREDAYEALLLMREELQERQAAAAAAAASRDKRMAALYTSAEALQERLLAAQEQYEVLKDRNQTELVRLNLQRAVDFRQALSRFAQVQLQLAQACASAWEGVVDQLNVGS